MHSYQPYDLAVSDQIAKNKKKKKKLWKERKTDKSQGLNDHQGSRYSLQPLLCDLNIHVSVLRELTCARRRGG